MPTATATEHIVMHARAFLTAYIPSCYLFYVFDLFVCVYSAHPYPHLLKME